MDTSSDDSRLINECLSGNEKAWHDFVTRFSKLVYHSINKTINPCGHNMDKEDIEDIYCGVFLSFIENDYRKLKQFKGKNDCTLSSWIRLVTIRHTIDFLRKQKPQVSLDHENENVRPIHITLKDDKPSAHDHMEMSEAAGILQEAIQDLEPSDRLFMELYYKKELSTEKIAGIMNISVSTVYSKKNRMREKLIKILKNKGLIA